MKKEDFITELRKNYFFVHYWKESSVCLDGNVDQALKTVKIRDDESLEFYFQLTDNIFTIAEVYYVVKGDEGLVSLLEKRFKYEDISDFNVFMKDIYQECFEKLQRATMKMAEVLTFGI